MTDKHKVYLKMSMDFTPETMGNLEVSINGSGEELANLLMMTMASDEAIYMIMKGAAESFDGNKAAILTTLAKNKDKITTSGIKIDNRKKE